MTPQPDFAILEAPGPSGPGASWAPWFAWLDASVDLVPVGPFAWVDVADGQAWGEADVEDGLVRGRSVATTGPLVTADVLGAGPGDALQVPSELASFPVRLTVSAAEGAIDRVAVLGEGGRVLATQVVENLPYEGTADVPLASGWISVAAWSTSGPDWAVSGPVWINPP
jgi:hypothetical protein